MDSTVIARTPPRKVFISYAREDQAFALRLAGDLDASGVTVWIDDKKIQGGESWVKKIHKGLRASKEVFFIDSPHSRDSDTVQSELIIAKSRMMRITPLHRGSSYEPWVLTAATHFIDFTNYDDGFEKLMELPPPPGTLRRRALILLNRIRTYRVLLAFLALALGIAACVYFFSPSNTSFSVAGGDAAAIVVRVRNRGGRPSMLAGNSFRLHFGSLPIETEPLVLLEPEKHSRIAGHDDVVIRLTADRLLTPKMRDEESYSTADDVRPLLAGAKVKLTAQVKESDDRFHMRSEEFFAERIKKFVLEEFPDDVP